MPVEHYTLSELHQDANSGLAYRVRLPVAQQPVRCLVLLHGVGSNERGMVDLAQGLDADTLVICARGPLSLGPEQRAWFRVAFTAEGPRIDPEEAEQARKALIALVTSLGQRYALASERMVIAGFSQGGIMSASVALSAPQLLAGFGLLSGRILPELRPYVAAPDQLAHLRAWVAHGEYDSKLPVEWAHRAVALLSEVGVVHRLSLYPMDHTISAATQADFVAWLGSVPSWALPAGTQ